MIELLLASQSPRRRELLSSLGYPLQFVDIDVDETIDRPIEASMVAEYLAQHKASAFDASTLSSNQVLVTADTVVVHKNEVLGKPHNIEQAKQMLRSLSNDQHYVYTGVCLTTHSLQHHFTEATTVWFDPLNEKEIDYYVTHHSVLDKAGAYGIQDWIGMVGISRIDGCFYNVMGLPVARIWKELKKIVDC